MQNLPPNPRSGRGQAWLRGSHPAGAIHTAPAQGFIRADREGLPMKNIQNDHSFIIRSMVKIQGVISYSAGLKRHMALKERGILKHEISFV